MDELDLHLQLVPYLDLDATFDPAPVLAEVRAQLHLFQPERQRGLDGGDGGWASLDLAKDDARFPHTLALASSLVDLRAAHGIQLLLLRAGGVVAPHSDSPDRPVNLSVNIALEQPAGCRTTIGLAHEVPFRRASAFLLNVAATHAVTNESREDRLHLVVRGRPRRDSAWLLARARAATGCRDAGSARAALDARKTNRDL